MDSNIKALIAKAWKDEDLDLEPGSHFLDEVLTIHVTGVVTKQSDTMVAPTASIPLIPTLALFFAKSGIAGDHAIRTLREAITEAMSNGKNMDQQIEARIKDVEAAVQAVKDDLIAKLPKQRRSGSVVTKKLSVEVLPVMDEVLAVA
jgi:hypothetical protein